MRGFTCKHARRMIEEAAFEGLDAEQEAALDVHLAICDDCRREAELWLNLRRAVRSAPLQSLPSHVEQRLLSGEEPTRRTPARRPAMPWVVAAAVAAVVVAALLWLPALRSGDEREALPIASDDPIQTRDADQLPVDAPPERIAGAAAGTEMWVQDGSAVEIGQNDRSEAHVALTQGFVLAKVGPNDQGFRFVVETPDASVTALGTLFSVSTAGEGDLVVRVAEGTVEVRSRGDVHPVQRVGAGQELHGLRGQPIPAPAIRIQRDLAFAGIDAESVQILAVAPQGLPLLPRTTNSQVPRVREQATPPPVDPSDDGVALLDEGGGEDRQLPEDVIEGPHPLDVLLALGHAHQRSGRYDLACESYEQAMAQFPDSDHAKTIRITVAQLQLAELGLPEQALTHFDRYLEIDANGPLAEEARVGRVRAMVRLGRFADVIAAAGEFEQAHPQSRNCSEVLRLRGDAFRELGQLDRAAETYEELLRRWPSSHQAEFARAGLVVCGGTE